MQVGSRRLLLRVCWQKKSRPSAAVEDAMRTHHRRTLRSVRSLAVLSRRCRLALRSRRCRLALRSRRCRLALRSLALRRRHGSLALRRRDCSLALHRRSRSLAELQLQSVDVRAGVEDRTNDCIARMAWRQTREEGSNDRSDGMAQERKWCEEKKTDSVNLQNQT
jgi:hypothetical protein